jgi:hypothetical protein
MDLGTSTYFNYPFVCILILTLLYVFFKLTGFIVTAPQYPACLLHANCPAADRNAHLHWPANRKHNTIYKRLHTISRSKSENQLIRTLSTLRRPAAGASNAWHQRTQYKRKTLGCRIDQGKTETYLRFLVLPLFVKVCLQGDSR